MNQQELSAIITFEPVNKNHLAIIFQWLAEPHMQEFWDNSQEHKDDIINFVEGRKTPSSYFNGIFSYWIGKYNSEPFCFLLTTKENDAVDMPALWKEFISTTGNTYSMDFGIGNIKYLGKKLAAPTLQLFTQFMRREVDSEADTFLIDPSMGNPRAIRVYEKAGFKRVGVFEMEKGVFEGDKSCLMVLRDLR